MTVVVGGQKSGKSGLAMRRAAVSDRPVVVMTPAAVRDDEFAARVARHRADRPAGWETVETFDLAAAIADLDVAAYVIVDALDTWLAERMESHGFPLGDEIPQRDVAERASGAVLTEIRAFADAVSRSAHIAVVIAGQPGLGVHAGSAGARAYVDLHGLALQALSERADEVLLVVAGRVLPLVPDPGDREEERVLPLEPDPGDREVEL
jgi:adenosyl cobinamide kinase/adenosyl cobinamide phosphate guanylyltransferase